MVGRKLDINNIHNKYVEPYRYPSMKYYETLKEKFLKDKVMYEKMVSEDRPEPQKTHVKEFYENNLKAIERLEHLKETDYFAEEFLCDGQDHWTDWKAYYLDQAELNYEQIDTLKDMKKHKLYNEVEHGPAINEEIRKFENFATANLRKAGVVKQRKWVPSNKDVSSIERLIKELADVE